MSALSPRFAIPLESGKIPASYLPSYVDDVLEFATTAAFPVTGESGKIYVAINAPGRPISYRWSGSAYVEVGQDVLANIGAAPATYRAALQVVKSVALSAAEYAALVAAGTTEPTTLYVVTE